MIRVNTRPVNVCADVNNLLFPVKLAIVLAGLALLTSCGYRAAYGDSRPEQRLTVVAAPRQRSADAAAVQEALAGARAELSRAGVLGPGSGYPRVELELLRVDEKSSGIVAEPVGGERTPLALGSSVGVVGRAWVVEAAGGPPTRDTGDVRRVERYAAQGDARLDAVRHQEAARSGGS